MCIAPLTIYIGKKGEKSPQETACRECWQCIENAVNDWVGRNIAESKTAVGTHAVTLTYGRDATGEVDHEAAALLTYSDVQKYLKLLRRHGFPVRYFVTGEYGSLKGRAHWHIMLYWRRADPTLAGGRWYSKGVPLDVNFDDTYHWPHGYSFWTSPTHEAVRYNCKYIQKGIGQAERQGHLAMSKKPPIGAVYFRDLAAMYVQQGLVPQSLEYSFPEVCKADGSPRVFMLKARSAELFLDHFIDMWARSHRDDMPRSVLLEEFLDAKARKDMDGWSSRKDIEAQATRERVRERIAAEMAALIELPVLPQHIDMTGGDPEYTLPGRTLADGSETLLARWRYDSRARRWRRLHWKKGEGWSYGERQQEAIKAEREQRRKALQRGNSPAPVVRTRKDGGEWIEAVSLGAPRAKSGSGR